jgi:putative ABC transport system permease protein
VSRVYRALLRLYPAGFRAEYGDELAAVFDLQYGDRRGIAARAVGLAAAMVDVVPNAIAAHADIARQDLRYVWRGLRRAPGFAITAVLVVALGVGANAAAFSVADFVLVKPLAFPRPDRLVKLWETTPGYGRLEPSPGNYRDWKTRARAFSEMAAYTNGAMNLVGVGEPQRMSVVNAQAGFFSVLGVHPLIGRTFAAADTLEPATVVLSYGTWQSQFGGTPDVLGRVLRLDGRPYRVIGVMPADFFYPTRDVELWLPLGFANEEFTDRANNYLNAVARLATGVSVAQAGAELDGIMRGLAQQYPVDNARTGARVIPLRQVEGNTRLLLLALCGAALCVLLLACANLGSLLIARAVARGREMAVRTALGAGRDRLLRQLVTESVLVAGIGSVVGALVAWIAVPALSRLVPDALPMAALPHADWRLVIAAALLVIVVGLLFGVTPAVRAGGSDSLLALREGGRAAGGARRRARGVLVAVQVMASVVLLVSSGLLVRAILRLEATDPGFVPRDVVALRTALPMPQYRNPETRHRFYTTVLDGVRALPAVSEAAYATGLPIEMGGGIWPVLMGSGTQVQRDAANSASMRFVSPGYFATMRVQLMAGRDIAESDAADQPYVAVVSRSFVQRYWPGESAIGKHFEIAMHDREIIGVAGDVRVRGFEQTSEPQVYLSYRQVEDNNFPFYTPKDLIVRSAAAPATLLPAIRRIVHDADPMQPVSRIRTLEQVVATETASRAAQVRVVGALAVVALLLAAVGMHGLLAFLVSLRSQEIGVRRALGARTSGIVALVLRQGLGLALLGLVPGLLIAYAAGRAMQSLLAGISPDDPLTLISVVAICIATALAGSAWPALKAARVDVLTALRAD